VFVFEAQRAHALDSAAHAHIGGSFLPVLSSPFPSALVGLRDLCYDVLVARQLIKVTTPPIPN